MIDKPTVRSVALPLKPTGAVLAAGAGAVATSLLAAQGVAGWFGAGLAVVMLAIAVIDGRCFLIPDGLNAAGLALGIFFHSIVLGQGDAGTALAEAALRAVIIALTFFALRQIYARLRGVEGIGLGDVKLAAVAGIWLGWTILPIAIEIAALSALSIHSLRSLFLRRPLRPTSRLPFGLYFAPAIWIGWLFQTTVLRGW